jgi:hypothetical protein
MFAQIVWEFGKLVQAVRRYYDVAEDERRRQGHGRFVGHQDLNTGVGDGGATTTTTGARGSGRGRGSRGGGTRGRPRGSTTRARGGR